MKYSKEDIKSAAQILFAKEEKTNFPNDGDNKKISIANSKYKEFDFGFAKRIESKYPSIWDKGGNGGSGDDKTSFTGNDAWRLYKAYKSGSRSTEVLNWVKRRESFMDRHAGNGKSIASVISWIKWGAVGSIGVPAMKKMLREAMQKEDQKKA
jgi:hypothetical protein